MLKLVALLTTLSLGLVIAQEGPKAHPDRPQHPRHEMKGRRPGGMGGPGGGAKRFENAKAEILKRYDANQDGTLSPAEQEKLNADLKAAQELTRINREYQLFLKLDADKDGKLSQEELKNARQLMQEMRGGPRPGAPRRPPHQPAED